ncbi:erythromycin esterase family protein [Streptomyces sp.]|uniref:erythromycin esterase family protein n=1 Tax=Streptomyces sp. TaxID=1931 RepID=UPI002F3EA27A
MTSVLPETNAQLEQVRDGAVPLAGPDSFDPLLERVGEARYVLLGEASHGTAEFYRWRATLTRRLIEERGFSFVAVEGDWPDCLAVHRSVTGAPGAPEDPADALAQFRRWPTWMWANTEVRDFARRLREHNSGLPPDTRPVGFFGLDVYSLWESLHAILDHLREHAPEHVEAALEAYRCFEPYAEDPQTYAQATRLVPSGREPEVLALLQRIRGRTEQPAADGGTAEFTARQNAEVLADAERYYRAMVCGGPESWNIRDEHMADTLDRLIDHYGPQAKAVVWAHNTHVSDARATDLADAGLLNLGQLVRERHAAEGVVLVGFGSYEGTVTAAERWGARPRVTRVPAARGGSTESLLHRALPDTSALFVFPPGPHYGRPVRRGQDWLAEDRDHRAIGVVYRPERERWGNYVTTVLGAGYDAFLYFDRTRALTPLQPGGGEPGEEETWPTGL